MPKRIVDNDTFVRENLEKLVKKYPHKIIVINNGEIFTGENAVRRARAKYPGSTPMWLPVPGPEEFNHLL